MYELISRLDRWIRDAAIDNSDPDDAPLHPPVAYTAADRLVIPRVDTPPVESESWVGFAELAGNDAVTEIVGWRTFESSKPEMAALAVLLDQQMPLEYPEKVCKLFHALEHRGIDRLELLAQLLFLAVRTGFGQPLLLVLGAPMRRVVAGGQNLQHLAVWEISGADADKLRDLGHSFGSSNSLLGESALRTVNDWASSADVGWCTVNEMRPEVTQRRDESAPMAWFLGKRVAIWGCGAIGTHVAESIVRSGASSVSLVDNGKVSPGLLVRQGFEFTDVGQPKAEALASRLKRIVPGLDATANARDIVAMLDDPEVLAGFDLIVDCTASHAVRLKTEKVLRTLGRRPPIASMSIDSRASAAIATLASHRENDGPMGLLRRIKVELCRRSESSEFLEAFWPDRPLDGLMQPEPGCSEPTFVGSHADVAGLSARMLNAIAATLSRPRPGTTGSGWVFQSQGVIRDFHWPADFSLDVSAGRYSVRVAPAAIRDMRAWARRSGRLKGSTVETGGLAFGEINDVAGVIWITDVEGPPPDSDAAEEYFTCGTLGMDEIACNRSSRFRGSVECVGSWHTHPSSAPFPSTVDVGAVSQILGSPESGIRDFALLILSGNPEHPSLGAHLFRLGGGKDTLIRVEMGSSTAGPIPSSSGSPRNIGLALSGGGSRAIAFHLGCMRALQDLRLLDQVQVISSVSGGSVIAAMYSYSDCDFEEFDARVVSLLRRGVVSDVVREALRPTAIASAIRRFAFTLVARTAGRLSRRLQSFFASRETIAPDLACRVSRTDSFRKVMSSKFGERLMREVGRSSLDVVINATELRTGSAFRFGNRRSGCWRFGEIDPNRALVADAVTASAAYPLFLPALERNYHFRRKGVNVGTDHVLLADGGLFDNLGVSPLIPGRDPAFSVAHFDPEFVIACDAGAGLLDGISAPNRLLGRVKRSFDVVFRKRQDATRNLIHELAATRHISGFALPYLGQRDANLPWIPPQLPRREEVKDYPTDFAPMDNDAIHRLALRGEILTRLLVAFYRTGI